MITTLIYLTSLNPLIHNIHSNQQPCRKHSLCVVYAVLCSVLCWKTLHKWQRSLALLSGVRFPFSPCMCVTKSTLCMSCSAEEGGTGSHKAASAWAWSTLGAVLPWVVSLVSREESMCAREGKRQQKGGELQHGEKEQTKDWQRNHKLKAASVVLPCLAHASSRRWKLCWGHEVARGVKMQSLGLDPWPACAKKAGGLGWLTCGNICLRTCTSLCGDA